MPPGALLRLPGRARGRGLRARGRPRRPPRQRHQARATHLAPTPAIATRARTLRVGARRHDLPHMAIVRGAASAVGVLPDRAELTRARACIRSTAAANSRTSTFMGDKHLFWSADHQAVVALRIGARSSRRARLALRSRSAHRARDPRFPPVRRCAGSRAGVLRSAGAGSFAVSRSRLRLFKLGELATIRLDEFTLAGKRWEDLRQAATARSRKS